MIVDEQNTINVLLAIAAIGIIIQVASVSVTADAMPGIFSNFIMPVACIKENSTYLLAMPTSLQFCDKLLDNARSRNYGSMDALCGDLGGADKSRCLSVFDALEKRVDDCTDYAANLFGRGFEYTASSPSSVSESEMDALCTGVPDILPAQSANESCKIPLLCR